MAHKIIKFNFIKDDEISEYDVFKKLPGQNRPLESMSIEHAKVWHLVSELDDKESTACGDVYWEYDYQEKILQKGGITCPKCLAAVMFYKSIKI